MLPVALRCSLSLSLLKFCVMLLIILGKMHYDIYWFGSLLRLWFCRSIPFHSQTPILCVLFQPFSSWPILCFCWPFTHYSDYFLNVLQYFCENFNQINFLYVSLTFYVWNIFLPFLFWIQQTFYFYFFIRANKDKCCFCLALFCVSDNYWG